MFFARLILLTAFLLSSIYAQIDLPYQKPPQEILDLADVDLPPLVRIDSKGEYMIQITRDQYKSIKELSEPEMRLAGLRINPKTNIYSRTRYYKSISILKVGEKDARQVKGLPDNLRMANLAWSPDEKKAAFTHTTEKGVQLWVVDIKEAEAKALTKDNLNANVGSPFEWYQDSEHLLVKVLPEDRKELIDKAETIPTGPTISINEGQKAQNRTYQDLLKDKIDESNFEQLVRSELITVDLKGKTNSWKETAMYRGVEFSPDGKYVLVSEMNRPFSYLVPYYRFPFTVSVYTTNGQLVKTIEDVPLIEELPKGFMAERTGKRSINWRNDKPATLYWYEVLDGGDPETEAEFRDALFQWQAPFENDYQFLFRVKNRLWGITWGNDQLAIARDLWWNNRNTKTYAFNPSDTTKEINVIFDRNYQDRYNDPGNFVTKKNDFGMRVLDIDQSSLYLMGDGYSAEGIYPFVDRYDLETGKTERLWRASDDKVLEDISFALNMNKGEILTRIEAKDLFPNYYIRNIKESTLKQITYFENPFEAIANVHKELITYKRDDGIDLSATLYLPADYDFDKKEKLPMVLWAYPFEFKDKASAGQITSSANDFTYPYYGSPIYWVTRGYAILDDASFPIIGEGENEPNDTFIPQLVANAKAAIDAVDSLGYIDRERVAVGGHSYGAFMTANLLSHSNLFAAGIARSGAYNRTLTPFGFQSEERTYWDAPNIYYEMSPFMHADSMKSPLLLIHGEADNNSGTYPLQSERYFNALKGLGAVARLVMLPKESHGYRARESVLHVLWEQDRWLEEHVKNKKAKSEQEASM